MKKTLLSIVTMAILASSSVYAASVNKDIDVEVEVLSSVKMTSPTGVEIKQLKLDYDTTLGDGNYNISQPIEISSINGYNKVKLRLAEEFKLEESSGTGKEFTAVGVMVGGLAIDHTTDQTINLANGKANQVLTVAGKASVDALDGEVYTGTVKLVMEPSA
ncbi:CS1 type fimbrial major subunit [Yersinia aldovae]|uniref:Alpha-related fimbriae minor subunit 1 n=1 Tax=Yersinia aldovae TaxID=29483 RepID=A0ABM9SV05_YERAL|nr:CS1 type fimbrial major subunit [Yersinia aldovae]CNK28482.1 alpha-related fimbriae minor subunit 1 [Yersinia aldovae]CNL27481.1 alpha-related fimbriae minor subunit 1 [Yersinia aldovae]